MRPPGNGTHTAGVCVNTSFIPADLATLPGCPGPEPGEPVG
jgi:hypothetical protein